MIRSGKYRHRVHIQEKTETRDSETGGVSYDWETVWLDSDNSLESVPAEVLTGPSREQRAAGTKHAEVGARISMRWFPGLEPTMRVLWDGKVFDITGISTDPTGRREYYLECKDGLTDGA